MKINVVSFYVIQLAILISTVIFLGVLRNTQIIDLSREVLLVTLTINIFAVLLMLRYLVFSRLALVLLTLLIMSFFIGIINNALSSRVILDLLKPLMFIFIYLIFSNLSEEYFLKLKKLLYKIAEFFLFSSFIGTGVMMIMLNVFGGYPGIRLPLVLSINKYAIQNKNKKLILSILLILVSGKRALLVGVIPVLFWKIKKLITFKNVFIVVLLIGIVIGSLDRILSYDISLFNKINYTLRNLSFYTEDENNLEALNRVTAQRLQEVMSALYGFGFHDYTLGKGLGYTYDLYDVNREKLLKENYGNNHFTPVSLLVSYGAIFMTLIYYKIIKLIRFGLREGKKHSQYLLFLGFVLFSFLLESFFSFNIFVNPFFPIVLGLIECKRKFIKNNEILLLH